MTLMGNPVRRLTQLYVGLLAYGASCALMVEARLGLDPWDVFHQGLARRTGLRMGWIVVIVGVAVLLLWIPLRQRPGIGTVSNAILVGLSLDWGLDLLPTPKALLVRWGFLIGGIVLNGLATGLYIGARLGPGPRDGLMTGYVARWPGRSVRLVRTVIEVTVLTIGWLFGGTVGWATLLYAISIGPLAHVFIPLFSVHGPVAAPAAAPSPSVDGGPVSPADRVDPRLASTLTKTLVDLVPESHTRTGLNRPTSKHGASRPCTTSLVPPRISGRGDLPPAARP